MATSVSKQDDTSSYDADKDAPSSTANAKWPEPVVSSSISSILSMLIEKKPERKLKRPRRDPKTIERANLLNICKLVIKELLDSSISQGRMLDDEHVPLQQFFVVLEHVLRHGIKPRKGILRDKKDFWCVLEMVEKLVPEASEISTSVRDMPHIKTPLGRARAWLRLATMQKTLADYFKVLMEKKDVVLSEFYDPGAMMVEDEGMVIAGLLVGLNVIDCNICVKEEDLDQPMGVIDFSLYLKDTRLHDQSPDEDSAEGKSKMATILDQKNYLEELNRHLNATVTNLQQKMETAQTTNALMKEDLAISKNAILSLQEENEILLAEKGSLLQDAQNKMESEIKTASASKQDIETERETYQTSRAGLDEMYGDMKKKLDDETHTRLDVEKELELQIGMKQEMEMALRILEKDIHEKQDTMISLRKQLEEIKTINLELYQKLQSCDQSLKHKTELVMKLEDKTTQLVTTLKDMEKRLKQADSDKMAAEETARKLGQVIADKDCKRTALETDLRIEREWRGTLQKTLEQEKETAAQLQAEYTQVKEVEKEYKSLQKMHMGLQQTCEEQERTLAELGSHLSESKLKVEDMREASQVTKEAAWMSDKDALQCSSCDKEFSLARRKHHCRNCGEIFCNECSDNKMPLPSSAKPVRVCDSCQTLLLQRYSSAGN
ncbi:RUN and FYVE domain-containing protein 2-like isoform X1 [Mizuhopecten yessoensis]|uniref:RUN and FYVE domain-containing protein 2-like isoform X1 n=1 Tax=Mizuhopecten yessoensis TaxID=6573 RepID=UPI000B458527|nr:RUN and FYVE domain-containing protein 2-like isoform X1 [Mizuhopecten yessoensis]